MRRYVLGLLLPLLAACAGKNTVAGEEKTKAEQLQESVPDWCAKACLKFADCEKDRPCNCDGDVCDCRVGNSCESDCHKAMAEFMNKGETCASAGLHFESCIDTSSCTELYTEGACTPTDPAEKLCYPQDSAATPTDVGSSTAYAGSASYDGPSSGGASAAGGASNGASYGGSVASAGASASGGATGVPIVTCQSSFSSGAAPGNTTNEICEGGALDCDDNHEYRYLCARTSDGQSACSCFVDDAVTGAFDPKGVCPSSDALNAGCRWNLNGI